ncbi:MAG: hypothetical protein ACPF9D_11775, partial [Owenweeksia sp.]
SFAGIEFQDVIYHYLMLDVPPFEDESYISSTEDYIVKLDFQLARVNYPQGGSSKIISTWEELNKDLLDDDFGKFIKKSRKVGEELLASDLKLNPDSLSDSERCRTIVDYVKSHYRWDGIQTKYPLQSTKDFLIKKTGNSAEINLFTTGLLEAAGFEVIPVLLSTRDNGKIHTSYPFSHVMNYVLPLVKMEGMYYFVDATHDYLPYNRIPAECINGNGLTVEEKDPSWVELSAGASSVTEDLLVLEIDPQTLNLQTTGQRILKDYIAADYREELKDDEKEIINKVSAFNKDWTVDEVHSLNYETLAKPYILSYKAHQPLRALDNNVVLHPFQNLTYSKNPFNQDNRKLPVDLIYRQHHKLLSTINIPKGYRVSQLPKNLVIANDLLDVTLVYENKDSQILCSALLSFKKANYSPEEYPELRKHMEKAVQSFNQGLILSGN